MKHHDFVEARVKSESFFTQGRTLSQNQNSTSTRNLGRPRKWTTAQISHTQRCQISTTPRCQIRKAQPGAVPLKQPIHVVNKSWRLDEFVIVTDGESHCDLQHALHTLRPSRFLYLMPLTSCYRSPQFSPL